MRVRPSLFCVRLFFFLCRLSCSTGTFVDFPSSASPSRSFTMSRRLRYTSSHSHESSPPGDCNSRPSAEQTKTATATVHPSLIVPSSFQATHSHRRQAPYPPTDLAAEYLQCGYEPAQYSRAPSEKPIDPRYTSTASAFEHVDPDSLHYSIAPSSLSFHVPNLSDPEMR